MYINGTQVIISYSFDSFLSLKIVFANNVNPDEKRILSWSSLFAKIFIYEFPVHRGLNRNMKQTNNQLSYNPGEFLQNKHETLHKWVNMKLCINGSRYDP